MLPKHILPLNVRAPDWPRPSERDISSPGPPTRL